MALTVYSISEWLPGSGGTAIRRASGAGDMDARFSGAPTFAKSLDLAVTGLRAPSAQAASAADKANEANRTDPAAYAAYAAYPETAAPHSPLAPLAPLAALASNAPNASPVAVSDAHRPLPDAGTAQTGVDRAMGALRSAGRSLTPERREKLMADMNPADRARFDEATPTRREAYLGWKDHAESVRQSARDFAGFFYGFLMKNMRGSVSEDALGHGGKGERVFQELLDEEMGNHFAASDRTGLVDMLHRGMTGPAPHLG